MRVPLYNVEAVLTVNLTSSVSLELRARVGVEVREPTYVFPGDMRVLLAYNVDALVVLSLPSRDDTAASAVCRG